MYDPKDVFTPGGLVQHQAHLTNMENALLWLINHADDLHIDALTDDHLDTIYTMHALLESRVLHNGDGETDDS